MLRLIFFLLLIFLLPSPILSQETVSQFSPHSSQNTDLQSSPLGGNAGGLLSLISTNNPQLRAARHANQAIVADARAENRLGETSVEYTPFYQKGVSGTASSELIVSQEFDFPTLYAARGRQTKAQQQMLDLQYATLRRDILLEAQQLCFDFATARQLQLLLRSRLAAADSLLQAFTLRLEQGDATRLDLNRIKMDRMAVSAEAIRNEASLTTLRHSLEALNGGQPIDEQLITTAAKQLADRLGHDRQTIDACTAVSSLEIKAAQASLETSQQELRVMQQSWLPSLTLGYRRNTELNEAQNGVLLGISLPLFGNTQKVKAARLRRSAAEEESANVQLQQNARQQSLLSQSHQLALLLDTYDEALLRQQLTLLHRAVIAGELSVIDYYSEADRIYAMLQDRLAIDNEYAKTLAQIYRDSL